MHPDYLDLARAAALYQLLDRTWPGIAAKLETARALGWNWPDNTTPFARFDGGRAIAHVGVLELPAWLNGGATRIAGIHAVCTDSKFRRLGHFRGLMTEALEYVDQHWQIAKLSTAEPALYEPFGFRIMPMSRFALPWQGSGGGQARPLEAQDLPWLQTMLSRREPVSNHFCALDDGWLLGVDEVLWSGGLSHLYIADDVLLAWEVTDSVLQLYDLAADHLPDLQAVLQACPWPFERVVLWFSPDRLAPSATTIDWPDDDFLMVRGPWPVTAPFAMSPLAAH